VLLFQCVVEPELAPANLTLETVECLSPAWHQIRITLPVVGTIVDVCAKFNGRRAGQDQKFRFTYTTPVDVGPISETAQFFRFPEEFFFVRAENTLTFDLAAEADVQLECPDTAAIGSSISCTMLVEAFSNVPDAAVGVAADPQLTTITVVPDVNPGDWDCSAAFRCEYVAAGGTLPVGDYAFEVTTDVVGPPGVVTAIGEVESAGVTIGAGGDEVQVYEDDTDTFLEIEKTSTATEVDPGGSLAYTVTVTNTGPNPATDARVFETPPPLLGNPSIRFVSGEGDWACSSGATLECTAPGLATGGVARFEVAGVVSPTAAAGAPIVNEVTVEHANDPFGPDFPVRAGAIVLVRGASTPATPVTATPTFTG
jgi:uncharacterized repeat protein (TIGR01451 family)